MKKRWIVAASLLLLCGVALIGVALAACGFDLGALDTNHYETSEYVLDAEASVIVVNTKETDVILQPSEDGERRVVCVERTNVRHKVTCEDGTLTVSVEDERPWYERWSLFSTKKLSVTIRLPAGEYERLTIENSTGGVSIPGDFSFGALDIKVSTGDVACAASVTGQMKIGVSTGGIRLCDLRVGELSLSASTGVIAASAVICDGNAEIIGRTGKVTLTDVVVGGRMSIKATTGDVTFARCDAAQISVLVTTGDVTGSLRTPKVFDASASTGKIEVPASGAGGSCEVRASTGNIRLWIEGE